MPNPKDAALMEFLIAGTAAGRVRWEGTVTANEYTASFKGKYNVVVHRRGPDMYQFTMKNDQDQEMLFITSDEDARVNTIFEAARRAALNVDAAIDEIVQN